MVTLVPYEDVFQLHQLLKAAPGNWEGVESLPVASPVPLYVALSAGDVISTIHKFYTVLIYDTVYQTQYIDTDGGSGFQGYRRPLSGTEQVIQWKILDDPLEGGGLKGEYYNNSVLSGSPVFVRYENVVHNWNLQPPVSGTVLGANYFSVRWTGYVFVTQTGDYRFRTVSDDGVRLYVDDMLVIDNWTTHAPSNNNSSLLSLVQGFVRITLEYFQATQGGEIYLKWATPATGATLFSDIPTESLFNPAF